jgi:phage replication-related protein YjqB (UPF0714/DUF867 family)
VLDELLSHPGVEEQLTLGSGFGVMAFHGGSLERMTDVIAREVARRSGASLYAVTQPDDLRWHVPSKEFDPARSKRLAAFVAHVDVAVAVHGFGRPSMFTTVLLGGSNRELAERIAAAARPRLPHYDIVDDLEAIPVELRGLHPDNPVNRLRRGGVQLELPPRVRGLGPYWGGERSEDAPGSLRPHTIALIDALVEVAEVATDHV